MTEKELQQVAEQFCYERRAHWYKSKNCGVCPPCTAKARLLAKENRG